MRTTLALSLALAALASIPCRADTVFLKNGTEVDGTVTLDSTQTVVIKLRNGGGTRSFRRADVETVVYDESTRASDSEPQPKDKPPSTPADVPAKGPEKKPAGDGVLKPTPPPDGLNVGAIAPAIEGKTWFTKDGQAPELKDRVYLIEFWFGH